MSSYAELLARKAQFDGMAGFEPLWLPDFLFGFQADLAEWAIRQGRAALMLDCGMGKSPMALVWAQNVYKHTGKPVLLLTPLGVYVPDGHRGREVRRRGRYLPGRIKCPP